MQIMICWVSRPSMLDQLLRHLQLIHAHTLLTLDHFILHLQILEVFQMVLILAVSGMVHQLQMKCQHHMPFPWMSTIMAGNTIALQPQQVALMSVLLIRCLLILFPQGQLELLQIYQDQDPICTHILLVTGNN